MAYQEISIAAGKKIYPFIIRQSLLQRDINKSFPIKFLYAIGKTDPAKIMFVESQVSNVALQQTFIYIITECVVTLN